MGLRVTREVFRCRNEEDLVVEEEGISVNIEVKLYTNICRS